jgi:hypothetical protein
MLRQAFYGGPSLIVLYQEYAQKHRVDDQAPIQASDEIMINAPTEAVWRVLIDIADWPVFNPVFSDVRLESDVSVGARASFKLNGFPIKATFAVVEPAHELTWVGAALWTKAIDRLVLEPVDRTTRLTIHESIAGAFVPLMFSRARLHEQHRASLKNFKVAAEREAGTGDNSKVPLCR